MVIRWCCQNPITPLSPRALASAKWVGEWLCSKGGVEGLSGFWDFPRKIDGSLMMESVPRAMAQR